MSLNENRAPGFKLDTATRRLALRLWRGWISRHRGRLVLAGTLMLVAAAATGAQPLLVERTVDRLTAREADWVWFLPPAILVLAMIKGLATYGQAVVTQALGLRVISDLQNAMFARLMRSELTLFHDTAGGRLVSRFVFDVNLMRDAMTKSLMGLMRDLWTVVVLVGAMFYLDWVLASTVFVLFPLGTWPVVMIGRRVKRASHSTQEGQGALGALLAEAFGGMRMIKAYRLEAYEEARVQRAVERVRGLMMKAIRNRARLHPIVEMLGGAAVAAVLAYGIFDVIYLGGSLGGLTGFLAALLMAYQPMRNLGQLNVSLQEGMAAAERVFSVLDRAPRILDRPGARPLAVREGEIRYEGVVFAYDGGGEALNRVDLVVPAGRTVALVGPSGAGKSTMLNLIPRFYDVQQGRILIDGQDVKEVTLDSLRGAIALVSQDVTLFNDTARANIAFGRPEASEADIVAAAKAAAAHDFITALPQGYDTVVGERGVRLSGGQQQRVAIARAMLKDAPILLLDEATSSLDTEAEQQVQAALERLRRRRTTLVIAHRLSTVVAADLICVLDEGRIVESGTHAQLKAQGGLYARLSRLQFRDGGAGEGADEARVRA